MLAGPHFSIFSTFLSIALLSLQNSELPFSPEQKCLAIGRGLMKNPEILLLDEPSEGLAPLVVRDLAEVILKIQTSGVTILMADQNIKFCRKVAGRGYIMKKGLIRRQGTLDEIWQDEEIVKKSQAF